MKIKDYYLSDQSGLVCFLGLFIAGYVFYSSSLIELAYTAEFHLSSWQTGIAQSAVPFGAILGAILAGRLADKFGRHRLLVLTMKLLIVSGFASAFIFHFYTLCLSRLLTGFLVGMLYPLCAAYLTETTRPQSIAKQIAILMFINCMSAPVGCLFAYLLSQFCVPAIAWRLINIAYLIPAIYTYFRVIKLNESPAWLMLKESRAEKSSNSIISLFHSSYRSITLCLLGTWFLMDVAYYGINFFIPYLLSVMTFTRHLDQTQSMLSSTMLMQTLIVNSFFMIGALAAIFAVDRVSILTLQKRGFLIASISLFCLAILIYAGVRSNMMITLLFVIFNVALNIGPDVTTYMLSATAYPVSIRGTGHGLNAGVAKIGSFLGVLFLPLMQTHFGIEVVILFLSFLLFAAYVLTIILTRLLAHQHTVLEDDIIYEPN